MSKKLRLNAQIPSNAVVMQHSKATTPAVNPRAAQDLQWPEMGKNSTTQMSVNVPLTTDNTHSNIESVINSLQKNSGMIIIKQDGSGISNLSSSAVSIPTLPSPAPYVASKIAVPGKVVQRAQVIRVPSASLISNNLVGSQTGMQQQSKIATAAVHSIDGSTIRFVPQGTCILGSDGSSLISGNSPNYIQVMPCSSGVPIKKIGSITIQSANSQSPNIRFVEPTSSMKINVRPTYRIIQNQSSRAVHSIVPSPHPPTCTYNSQTATKILPSIGQNFVQASSSKSSGVGMVPVSQAQLIQLPSNNSPKLSPNQSLLMVNNQHLGSNSPRLVAPNQSVLLINPTVISKPASSIVSPPNATPKSVIVSSHNVLSGNIAASSSLAYGEASDCVSVSAVSQSNLKPVSVLPLSSHSVSTSVIVPNNDHSNLVAKQTDQLPSTVFSLPAPQSNPNSVVVGQLPVNTFTFSPSNESAQQDVSKVPNEFLGFTNHGQMVWVKRVSIPVTAVPTDTDRAPKVILQSVQHPQPTGDQTVSNIPQPIVQHTSDEPGPFLTTPIHQVSTQIPYCANVQANVPVNSNVIASVRGIATPAIATVPGSSKNLVTSMNIPSEIHSPQIMHSSNSNTVIQQPLFGSNSAPSVQYSVTPNACQNQISSQFVPFLTTGPNQTNHTLSQNILSPSSSVGSVIVTADNPALVSTLSFTSTSAQMNKGHSQLFMQPQYGDGLIKNIDGTYASTACVADTESISSSVSDIAVDSGNSCQSMKISSATSSCTNTFDSDATSHHLQLSSSFIEHDPSGNSCQRIIGSESFGNILPIGESVSNCDANSFCTPAETPLVFADNSSVQVTESLSFSQNSNSLFASVSDVSNGTLMYTDTVNDSTISYDSSGSPTVVSDALSLAAPVNTSGPYSDGDTDSGHCSVVSVRSQQCTQLSEPSSAITALKSSTNASEDVCEDTGYENDTSLLPSQSSFSGSQGNSVLSFNNDIDFTLNRTGEKYLDVDEVSPNRCKDDSEIECYAGEEVIVPAAQENFFPVAGQQLVETDTTEPDLTYSSSSKTEDPPELQRRKSKYNRRGFGKRKRCKRASKKKAALNLAKYNPEVGEEGFEKPPTSPQRKSVFSVNRISRVKVNNEIFGKSAFLLASDEKVDLPDEFKTDCYDFDDSEDVGSDIVLNTMPRTSPKKVCYAPDTDNITSCCLNKQRLSSDGNSPIHSSYVKESLTLKISTKQHSLERNRRSNRKRAKKKSRRQIQESQPRISTPHAHESITYEESCANTSEKSDISLETVPKNEVDCVDSMENSSGFDSMECENRNVQFESNISSLPLITDSNMRTDLGNDEAISLSAVKNYVSSEENENVEEKLRGYSEDDDQVFADCSDFETDSQTKSDISFEESRGKISEHYMESEITSNLSPAREKESNILPIGNRNQIFCSNTISNPSISSQLSKGWKKSRKVKSLKDFMKGKRLKNVSGNQCVNPETAIHKLPHPMVNESTILKLKKLSVVAKKLGPTDMPGAFDFHGFSAEYLNVEASVQNDSEHDLSKSDSVDRIPHHGEAVKEMMAETVGSSKHDALSVLKTDHLWDYGSPDCDSRPGSVTSEDAFLGFECSEKSMGLPVKQVVSDCNSECVDPENVEMRADSVQKTIWNRDNDHLLPTTSKKDTAVKSSEDLFSSTSEHSSEVSNLNGEQTGEPKVNKHIALPIPKLHIKQIFATERSASKKKKSRIRKGKTPKSPAIAGYCIVKDLGTDFSTHRSEKAMDIKSTVVEHNPSNSFERSSFLDKEQMTTEFQVTPQSSKSTSIETLSPSFVSSCDDPKTCRLITSARHLPRSTLDISEEQILRDPQAFPSEEISDNKLNEDLFDFEANEVADLQNVELDQPGKVNKQRSEAALTFSRPITPNLNVSNEPDINSDTQHSLACSPRHERKGPKIEVLQYKPPLVCNEKQCSTGNYPFSESLRRILQEADCEENGLTKKVLKRRIKVTPLIPLSLNRKGKKFGSTGLTKKEENKRKNYDLKKMLASMGGDTYIVSEFESDFVNLNKLSSKSFICPDKLSSTAPSTVAQTPVTEATPACDIPKAFDDSDFVLDCKEFEEELASQLEAADDFFFPTFTSSSTFNKKKTSYVKSPQRFEKQDVIVFKDAEDCIPDSDYFDIHSIEPDIRIAAKKELLLNNDTDSKKQLPTNSCVNSSENIAITVDQILSKSPPAVQTLLSPCPRRKKVFLLRNAWQYRQLRRQVLSPNETEAIDRDDRQLAATLSQNISIHAPFPEKVKRASLIFAAFSTFRKRNFDFVDWRDGDLLGSYAPHPLCKKSKTSDLSHSNSALSNAFTSKSGCLDTVSDIKPELATIDKSDQESKMNSSESNLELQTTVGVLKTGTSDDKKDTVEIKTETTGSSDKKKRKKIYKSYDCLVALNAALRKLGYIGENDGTRTGEQWSEWVEADNALARKRRAKNLNLKTEIQVEAIDENKNVSTELMGMSKYEDGTVGIDEGEILSQDIKISVDNQCADTVFDENVKTPKHFEDQNDSPKQFDDTRIKNECKGKVDTSPCKSEIKCQVKEETISKTKKMTFPNEITPKDIHKAMVVHKVKTYIDFKNNLLSYLTKGRDCNPLLTLFKIYRRKKTKTEQDLIAQVDERGTMKPGIEADPKAVAFAEQEVRGAKLWAAVDEEVERMNAKRKEELRLIIKDARVRAAATRNMMRQAALKENTNSHVAASTATSDDSSNICQSGTFSATLYESSEFVTLENVDSMEWADDPFAIGPIFIDNVDNADTNLTRYQRKKLKRIEEDVAFMKRLKRRGTRQRTARSCCCGIKGDDEDKNCTDKSTGSDLITSQLLAYFSDHECSKSPHGVDDPRDEDYCVEVGESQDENFFASDELDDEELEDDYFDQLYYEFECEDDESLTTRYCFEKDDKAEVSSKQLHSKSTHISDDECEDFGLPVPKTVKKCLKVKLYHGHVIEDFSDKNANPLCEPEEPNEPVPDILFPPLPCTFKPFVEPVIFSFTQTLQLTMLPRITLKRIRYLHIVNRFCKRHHMNLRSAFRTRRRLRYWEDRNDEAAFLEAYKKAPRTLDDFFAHAIFADAILEPDDGKGVKRKRIMIEFNREKRWEEYDDEYNDDYYKKKHKGLSVSEKQFAKTSLLSNHDFMASLHDPNILETLPSLGAKSVGTQGVLSPQMRSSCVSELGEIVGMYGRPRHSLASPNAIPPPLTASCASVAEQVPTLITTPQVSAAGQITSLDCSAVPVTDISHGSVVFNYEKGRYEILPILNSNSVAEFGRPSKLIDDHLLVHQQLQQATAAVVDHLNELQRNAITSSTATTQHRQYGNLLLDKTAAVDANGQPMTVRTLQTPYGAVVKVVTKVDGSSFRIGSGGTIEKLPVGIQLPDVVGTVLPLFPKGNNSFKDHIGCIISQQQSVSPAGLSKSSKIAEFTAPSRNQLPISNGNSDLCEQQIQHHLAGSVPPLIPISGAQSGNLRSHLQTLPISTVTSTAVYSQGSHSAQNSNSSSSAVISSSLFQNSVRPVSLQLTTNSLVQFPGSYDSLLPSSNSSLASEIGNVSSSGMIEVSRPTIASSHIGNLNSSPPLPRLKFGPTSKMAASHVLPKPSCSSVSNFSSTLEATSVRSHVPQNIPLHLLSQFSTETPNRTQVQSVTTQASKNHYLQQDNFHSGSESRKHSSPLQKSNGDSNYRSRLGQHADQVDPQNTSIIDKPAIKDSLPSYDDAVTQLLSKKRDLQVSITSNKKSSVPSVSTTNNAISIIPSYGGVRSDGSVSKDFNRIAQPSAVSQPRFSSQPPPLTQMAAPPHSLNMRMGQQNMRLPTLVKRGNISSRTPPPMLQMKTSTTISQSAKNPFKIPTPPPLHPAKSVVSALPFKKPRLESVFKASSVSSDNIGFNNSSAKQVCKEGNNSVQNGHLNQVKIQEDSRLRSLLLDKKSSLDMLKNSTNSCFTDSNDVLKAVSEKQRSETGSRIPMTQTLTASKDFLPILSSTRTQLRSSLSADLPVVSTITTSKSCELSPKIIRSNSENADVLTKPIRSSNNLPDDSDDPMLRFYDDNRSSALNTPNPVVAADDSEIESSLLEENEHEIGSDEEGMFGLLLRDDENGGDCYKKKPNGNIEIAGIGDKLKKKVCTPLESDPQISTVPKKPSPFDIVSLLNDNKPRSSINTSSSLEESRKNANSDAIKESASCNDKRQGDKGSKSLHNSSVTLMSSIKSNVIKTEKLGIENLKTQKHVNLAVTSSPQSSPNKSDECRENISTVIHDSSETAVDICEVSAVDEEIVEFKEEPIDSVCEDESLNSPFVISETKDDSYSDENRKVPRRDKAELILSVPKSVSLVTETLQEVDKTDGHRIEVDQADCSAPTITSSQVSATINVVSSSKSSQETLELVSGVLPINNFHSAKINLSENNYSKKLDSCEASLPIPLNDNKVILSSSSCDVTGERENEVSKLELRNISNGSDEEAVVKSAVIQQKHQMFVRLQQQRRLQYLQESQRIQQQQLAAAAAVGSGSNSAALALAAALSATATRDPDGEMMLPFPCKELPHCCRPDPDQHRTAAQVSPIVNVIRLALCAGFPPVEHHIRSAVYQLSLAWGICCKYHAIGLAEWSGLTKMLGLQLLPDPKEQLTSESEKEFSPGMVMFTPPSIPSIPMPEQICRGLDLPNLSDPKTPTRSLIIVERLVFAVDRRSREVFLPLPNWVESVQQIEFDLKSHMNMKKQMSNPGGGEALDSNSQSRANNPPDSRPCQPNPNSVELLSVVVSFTPSGCLLPGLIVFPGTLMTYRLRHSLDGTSGGRDWILSSRGSWRSRNGKCTKETSTESNNQVDDKCCPGGHIASNCRGTSSTCGLSQCNDAVLLRSSPVTCLGEIYLENSDRSPIEEYLSRLVVGWGKAHLPPPLFLHLPQQYHYTVTGKYEVGGECCCRCSCQQQTSQSKLATGQQLDFQCARHGLQHLHVVPNVHRIVQDVGIVTSTHDCISMILMERVAANWGVMVRQWTQKHGALLEHSFPAFLLHYLPMLLNPGLLKRFARVAGLDTFDRKRMERFNRHSAEYRNRWAWVKK